MRRIYRYTVPVNDKPHVVPLSHSPVAVAAAGHLLDPVVEFWCEHTDGEPQISRAFQVFGTGHRLPALARWIGTCRTAEGLVWHLYEVTP